MGTSESEPQHPKNPKQTKLENALGKLPRSYRRRSEVNESWAVRTRYVLIFLSALTTIVVGLNFSGWEPIAKNIALVLSAMVTAIASFESLKDHRGKWLLSREIYLELKNLRACYEFEINGAKQEQIEEIVNRYWTELQSLLRRAHKNRIEGLEEATRSKK